VTVVRILALPLFCAYLAGCQTDSSASSGHLEVTIQNMMPEQVKPQLVNAMINEGGRLRNDSTYLVTFERPRGDAASAALIGALVSTEGVSAIERLAFSIAEARNGTRIVVDRYMVTVGSFGREDIRPANSFGLEPLQHVLDRVVGQIKT
jgi:hypothetical protein